MHQADLVRGMHSLGHLLDDQHRTRGIQRPLSQYGFDVAPVDQPHIHEQAPVDLPVSMNRHHMRLVQLGGGVGLAAEALLEHAVFGEV